MVVFDSKSLLWLVVVSLFLVHLAQTTQHRISSKELHRSRFFHIPKRIQRSLKTGKEECGGNITVTSVGGKLTSPGYPRSYPSDLDCRWLLTAARDTNLVLTVISLNIERFANCTYDYLDIYSGITSDDPLLRRMCGNANDIEMKLNSTSALLSFTTDSTFEERGFEILYGLEGLGQGSPGSTVCGQKLSGKSEGNVTSPDYPESYLPNLDCITIIEVPPGSVIYLKFEVLKLEFDEECGYDYVTVYDGPTEGYPKLGHFCSNPATALVKSTNNTMLLHFHSDSILSEIGYLAHYSTQGFVGESGSVGACNWVRGEEEGSIWSPEYPAKYPGNSRCKIDLEAPVGFYVSLTFQELQLEPDRNCSYDYIMIKDGPSENSPLLRTLCGSYNPNPVINSTGNRMLFRFLSDGFTEFKGFMAHYKFIEDLSKKRTQTVNRQPLQAASKLQGFALVSPNATVLQGKRHAISCVPRSTTARIRWFKEKDFLGGRQLPKGLKILGNTALEIGAMEPELVGRYTCVIVDDDNESTTNATVWLSMAFDDKECDIIFRDVPYDVVITERIEYKLLECSSTGPNVIITWEKDGVKVNDSRFQILPKGHLYVDKLRPTDQGFYTCVATNTTAGCQKRASAIVTVKRLINVTEICGIPKLGLPAKDKPVLDSGRIVGGVAAKKGAHPWQVMFWEPKLKAFCGGVLLNERWVVSAAHCFEPKLTARVNWPEVKMKLGKLDQAETEPQEFSTEIAEILPHPSYNIQTFDNDVALVKLKEDVTFSDYILPICLGNAKTIEEKIFGPEHRLGIVTGWGKLSEDGAVPRILRELQLPIVKQKTCSDSTTSLVTRNMFCAGYAQEIVGDACKGDSGGPFVIQLEGRFYLAGLVSWGKGCAKAGQYGFYTRISNYHSWIKGILETA